MKNEREFVAKLKPLWEKEGFRVVDFQNCMGDGIPDILLEKENQSVWVEAKIIDKVTPKKKVGLRKGQMKFLLETPNLGFVICYVREKDYVILWRGDQSKELIEKPLLDVQAELDSLPLQSVPHHMD